MLSKKETDISFDKFNKMNILIIGDIMIDSYIWGKVERISPEAPVPIVAVTQRENRLGGAGNVAINIKALGANPIICSVIGNDQKAEDLIDLLNKAGMEKTGIILSKKRITTVKFRVIGNNTQLLRVDEEIDKPLDKTDSTKLLNKILNIISKKNIAAVIFQDYDKGVINPHLINTVIKKTKSLNIPVTVDPKKHNFLCYKNVTLFKPNLKEFKEGLNIKLDIKNQKELKETLLNLHKTRNIDILLLTLSSEGLIISKKDKQHQFYHIKGEKRNIADVSGAGDTVISVATVCLAAGLDLFSIGLISNLAGGLVCEQVGVVPVNKEKLKFEINSFKNI
ncbi:MAG: hypothetical protein KA792_07645 [Bacteroidales bacterium]|nr:hypothetical protein [Bacteroidales bacterium]